MTGRDLIVYILENGLENEPVFKDGSFIGFISARRAAVMLDTGVETIHAMIKLGQLDSVWVNGGTFIPADLRSPSDKESV